MLDCLSVCLVIFAPTAMRHNVAVVVYMDSVSVLASAQR